jgi:hypothetical protein
LGFDVGLTNPQVKKIIVTKVEQRKKLDRFDDDGRKSTEYTERDLQMLRVRRWRVGDR